METRPRVLARNIALAEKLASENGGSLPNPNRLIEMGHEALYRYILRHPDKFEEFEYQEAVRIQNDATFNIAIREAHSKTVSDLINLHGSLPTPKWLIAHGFTKLASYMRIHPGIFSTPEKKSIMLHATPAKSTTHKKRRKKRVHNRK